MNEKAVDESLEHIRLIHFTLMIACGTIIYLVLSSWTPANELVLDLKEYMGFAKKVEKTFKEPEALPEILPTWEAFGVKPIEQSLSARLGINIQLHDQSRKLVRIVSIEPDSFPDKFDSLEQSRNALEKFKWRFEVIGDTQSDMADVRQWVQETMKQEEESSEHSGWLGPLAVINVKRWTYNNQTNHMEILADVEIILREQVVYATGGETPVMGTETHSNKFNDKILTPSEHSESLSPDWLTLRFPWLTKYWDNVKSLQYERAITWAEDQRVEGLKSRNPNLFGIEMKGEHLAYIGPLIVLAVLLYLLSFLMQLRQFFGLNWKEAPALSPWIGTMTNVWAQIVTRVTFVVGPFLAVGLPLWRLLGLHWLLSALLSVIPAYVGYRAAIISDTLAHILADEGAIDSGPVLSEVAAKRLRWICGLASFAPAYFIPIFFGEYIRRTYYSDSFFDSVKPILAIIPNALIYAAILYFIIYIIIWTFRKV